MTLANRKDHLLFAPPRDRNDAFVLTCFDDSLYLCYKGLHAFFLRQFNLVQKFAALPHQLHSAITFDPGAEELFLFWCWRRYLITRTERLSVHFPREDVLGSNHGLGRAVFPWFGGWKGNDFAGECLILHHDERARFQATCLYKIVLSTIIVDLSRLQISLVAELWLGPLLADDILRFFLILGQKGSQAQELLTRGGFLGSRHGCEAWYSDSLFHLRGFCFFFLI